MEGLTWDTTENSEDREGFYIYICIYIMPAILECGLLKACLISLDEGA